MRLHKHPSILKRVRVTSLARLFSTTAMASPSSVYMDLSKLHEPAVATTPHDMTHTQRQILDAALRVDQAGEVAANWIYKGQMAVLGRDPMVGPVIQV